MYVCMYLWGQFKLISNFFFIWRAGFPPPPSLPPSLYNQSTFFVACIEVRRSVITERLYIDVKQDVKKIKKIKKNHVYMYVVMYIYLCYHR